MRRVLLFVTPNAWGECRHPDAFYQFAADLCNNGRYDVTIITTNTDHQVKHAGIPISHVLYVEDTVLLSKMAMILFGRLRSYDTLIVVGAYTDTIKPQWKRCKNRRVDIIHVLPSSLPPLTSPPQPADLQLESVATAVSELELYFRIRACIDDVLEL